MDYALLGKNIKKYRGKKHLTQKRLAEAIGCTDSYVASLKGGHNCPSLEILLRIADTLEVTPNHLLVDCIKFPELVYLSELEEKLRKYPTAAKITACDAMRDILKLIEQLQNR